MTNYPFHVSAGSARGYAFREHLFRFLATGDQTGGTHSAMEISSPRDTGPGPHTHELAEEHFFLLEGAVVFQVAGQTFDVKAADFVHVPRATVHQFTVATDRARMLATYTPAGEEMAFREASTPLTDQ